MRRVVLCLPAAAAVAAVAVAASGARDTPAASASAKQGQRSALVNVRGARARAAAPIVRRHGGTLVSRRLRVWRVPAHVAPRLLAELRRAGADAHIEADQPARPLGHLSAGDPLIRSWLTVVGADRSEPPGPGKSVTVIDSGIDLSHPEFASRPDTVALNEQRTRGRDEELFHGTAVSSVVAAPANGIGLVGIYPQALLKSWDVMGDGLGDVVRGLDAASASGAGVINLSLGFDRPSKVLSDAVNLAFGRGSLVIAAGGNERQQGNPASYPADLPHVLTIAATDEDGRVASFSNRTRWVDLAAPGQRIPVAVPVAFRQSGFFVASGTSFSAPMVSGASAWVWTARPELHNTQLFEVMRLSARDIPPAGFDADTGFGMLDVPGALSAAAPAPDPQEPNDDVDLVGANGVFPAAKPALTRPGTTTASVAARVDAYEDPRDVYRVWAPARRTVVATVTTRGDVDLEAWRPAATSVRQGAARQRIDRSAALGGATETVRIRNTRSRGDYYYVNVLAARNARGPSYVLSLVTRPL